MIENKSAIGNKPVALVTGATGFIGSHLVRRLHDEGFAVKVFSRQKYCGDIRVQVNSNNWISAELTDDEALLSACEGVDVVFHAANITHSNTSADELFAVNVMGSQRLYSAAVDSKVGKFVFFSSILATNPKHSDYAESKWLVEQFITSSERTNSGIRVIILRPATVYGPGMRGNIMTFIKVAKSGFAPRLPRLRNSFPLISVEDLCDIAVRESQKYSQAGDVKRFIVTDGERYTPNRIESAVNAYINNAKPSFRVPLMLIYIAALFAQLVDWVGIKKNRMGLNLYRNLIETRDFSTSSGVPSYDFVPTATLETEMPRIIESLDVT